MAKLTDEQAKALAELEALRDAPESESKGRNENLNFTIDLSDEAAVGRALKLGLLRAEDLEDAEEEDEEEEDEQPRRRLTGADKLMGA